MRTAIAYIRVSTAEQGKSGLGSSVQRKKIQEFAKLASFRVAKYLYEEGSGMGDDSIDNRPVIQQAIALSGKWRCPILVSQLDRFSRHEDTIKLYVDVGRVVSATQAEQASSDALHIAAAGAQLQGETIARLTKLGLRAARAKGVRLGNTKNLAEAQRIGQQKNRALAKLRREEFAAQRARVQRDGFFRACDIAGAFNERKFLTPRGLRWTAGNVRRAMGKERALRRAGSALSSAPVPVAFNSIAGPDGRLSPDVLKRLREAMSAKGATAEAIDTVVERAESRQWTEASLAILEARLSALLTARRPAPEQPSIAP